MTTSVLLRRLVGGIVVLWLVSVLTFSLIQLVPGDTAQVVAGDTATPQRVEQIRNQLGLNHALVVQYVDWLSGILHGDFGNSLFTQEPVTHAIFRSAPPTLAITVFAMIIAVGVGIPAGIIAGVRHGSWVDRAVSMGATAGIAMPGFWVAMIFILIFALELQWLPATDYVALADGVVPWFQHAILPAAALGLATGAQLARHARGSVTDVLARPYIRTALARGISHGRLIRKHVIRNAAIPVVTVLGMQLGYLLGGAIVIEMVFGINGLGTLAVNSILQRDYPILQGYVMFAAVILVAANLVVDLLYGWLNPKVAIA